MDVILLILSILCAVLAALGVSLGVSLGGVWLGWLAVAFLAGVLLLDRTPWRRVP